MKVLIYAIEVQKGHEVWSLDGTTRIGIVTEVSSYFGKRPTDAEVTIVIQSDSGVETIKSTPYGPILVERDALATRLDASKE